MHERSSNGSAAHAIATRPLGLIEFFVGAFDEVGGRAVTVFDECGAEADGDFDAVGLEDEGVIGDFLAQRFRKRNGSRDRCFGQDDGKLFTAVTSEHFIAANPCLNDARDFLQHVVAGEMTVDVVDALEVIDVEHEHRQLSFVALAADDLAFECFVEVALVVDLRETIDDGHPVDFFVVLSFDVRAGEVLENRRANLDTVAIFQDNLARDLLVVAVGAVGAPIIDEHPCVTLLLELRVSARNAVAVQDDLVVTASTNTRWAGVEREAFAQERGLFRVDDDETIGRGLCPRVAGGQGLHDLRNASLFFEVVHACSARYACAMGRSVEQS